MIYLFTNLESDILKYKDKLPKSRQEKLDKLVLETDKKASVVAYLLLMYALKAEHLPEFLFTTSGKPYFMNDTHFNLSHCKNAVACAISDKPIGVDVQDIRHFNIGILDKVCNQHEITLLQSSKNIERDFAKIWSQKESIVKQSGDGIAKGLKNVIPDCQYELSSFPYENFYLSVCSHYKEEVIFLEDMSYFI